MQLDATVNAHLKYFRLVVVNRCIDTNENDNEYYDDDKPKPYRGWCLLGGVALAAVTGIIALATGLIEPGYKSKDLQKQLDTAGAERTDYIRKLDKTKDEFEKYIKIFEECSNDKSAIITLRDKQTRAFYPEEYVNKLKGEKDSAEMKYNREKEKVDIANAPESIDIDRHYRIAALAWVLAKCGHKERSDEVIQSLVDYDFDTGIYHGPLGRLTDVFWSINEGELRIKEVYRVQRGDTLSSVATDKNVNYKLLVDVNNSFGLIEDGKISEPHALLIPDGTVSGHIFVPRFPPTPEGGIEKKK